MSYDISIGVLIKGEGSEHDDYMFNLTEPELANPTYNLRGIFTQSTGWNYKQGVWYKCEEVIPLIEIGILELKYHAEHYRHLEPENGWGTVEAALAALESIKKCINETKKQVPMHYLYMKW